MRSLHFILALSLLPLAGCGEEADNTLFVACLRTAACGVRDYSNISECVGVNYTTNLARDGLTPLFDGIYKCVAAAGTCDAVKACYGVGASCDRTTYKASCAGGKATTCYLLDHRVYVYDCAGAGITCKLGTGSDAWYATCEGPRTSPTLPTRVDCGGGDLCSASGESCQVDAFDTCSGARLKACLDGQWILFDCQALGLGDCYTSSSTTPPTSSCGLPL